MARKQRTLSMWYRVRRLPAGGVSKQAFFSTLLQAVESGSGSLPFGWDVEWGWRNSEGDRDRLGPFTEVVRNSGRRRAAGRYLEFMASRIRRDAAKAGIALAAAPESREATEEELAAIETEEEEGREELAAVEAKRKRSKRSASKTAKRKRSQAAKRGWAKRRKRSRRVR